MKVPSTTIKTPRVEPTSRAGTSGLRSGLRSSLRSSIGQLQWLSQHLIQDIHRGIFAQTLLVTLGVALVPAAGLLVANQRSARLQHDALKQSFETAAIVTGLKADHWLETNRLALQQNAANPNIASRQTELQTPILQSLVATYPWNDVALSIGLDGYPTARSDDQPVLKWDGSKANTQGNRPYFQQILNGADFSSELLISDTTGEPALCMAVPIRQQARLAGVLASCSPLEAIVPIISQTQTQTQIQTQTQAQLGKTGIAILLDANNRVIANEGALRISEALEDFSDYPAIQGQTSTAPASFTWRGREVTAYVKPVGQAGWKLILQQDTAEVEQPIAQSRWNTLGLVIATGGLTLLIAYAFSRQLVRPLKSLSAGADAVSRGHFDVPIEGVDRSDEIGALARSVKRLAASVAILRSLAKPIAFDELS